MPVTMGGITKPDFGSPCTGCGLCCIAQQCPVGEMLLGPHDLCPALTQQGNIYACGLICDTKRFYNSSGDEDVDAMIPKAIALVLGAGQGCDARLEDEDVSPEAEDLLTKGMDVDAGKIAITFLTLTIPLLKRWPGGV